MLPLRDHEPSTRIPIVTIGLIILNAAVFFLELTSPDLDAFIQTWALVPSALDFAHPQSFLPFLTSQFLHGGLAHILFNMWYLWIFGDNVEGHFGHGTFLLFYLASGIVAAFAELPLLLGSDIPMLGASGAIAGVLGAYLALFPRNRIDALVPTFIGFWTRTTLPANIVLFFWFITQIFSGAGAIVDQVQGGVAWWAHIGGFVFGWIIGKIVQHSAAPLRQGSAGPTSL